MKKKVLYVIFICLALMFTACDFLGDDKDSPSSSQVLKGITVSANPTKTSYFTGEALDLTGIAVLAEYTDNSTKTIGKDDITNSGYDSNTIGTQTITVTYQEKSASFQVTVTAVSVNSIAIKTPISKNTYYYDDDLDTSGLEIEGTYNNGEKRTLDNSSITFTGYNKTDYTSVGQTITATYNNQTTTFDIVRTPFNYTISGDNVTITGYHDQGVKAVVIPETISGKTVVAIGNDAFKSKTLTSVVFPNTLTSIGISAFESCDLRSIDIPSGVADIPENAFYHNNNLNQITLHDGLRTIGTNAFRKGTWSAADIYVNLNEIPSTVESIGYGAFALVGLGRNDVNYTLTIPASCQSIGAESFYSSALRILILENGVKTIGNTAFFTNYLTSVTVPASVTSIGSQAFTSNNTLNDGNVNYYSDVDATTAGAIFDVAIAKD